MCETYIQEIEELMKAERPDRVWQKINNDHIKVDINLLEKISWLPQFVYAGMNDQLHDLYQNTYYHHYTFAPCKNSTYRKLKIIVKEYFFNRDFYFVRESGILGYGPNDDFWPDDRMITYQDFLTLIEKGGSCYDLLMFLHHSPYRYNPNEVDVNGETILFKMTDEMDIMRFIKIYIYDVKSGYMEDEIEPFNHHLTNFKGEYWFQNAELEEKDLPLGMMDFDPYGYGKDAKEHEYGTYAERFPNSKFLAEFNSEAGKNYKKLHNFLVCNSKFHSFYC